MKKYYEKPEASLYEMTLEHSFLNSAVESMRTVDGSWDEENW